MTRGRDKSFTADELLVEVYLSDSELVGTTELQNTFECSDQTVRNRARDLEELGRLERLEQSGNYYYRLTASGREYVKDLLRDSVD